MRSPRVATSLIAALAAPLVIACGNPAGSSEPSVPELPAVSAPPPAPPVAAAPPAAPPASASLVGTVVDYHDRPLAGALVTAHDGQRGMNVSVYTDGNGRYRFPPLEARSYRLRVRIIGHETREREIHLTRDGLDARFQLRLAENVHEQLPASYYYSLVEWPSSEVKGNFALACANCHQIGDPLWRKQRTPEQWEEVVQRMEFRGPPLLEETRALLIPAMLKAFDPETTPRFEIPGPPTGDATRAVLWEYEVDPEGRNGCHDLELGLDGWVYTEDGFAVNPQTLERRRFPVNPRAHSIERAPDGNMWITVTGVDQLEKLDVTTGEVTAYDHPQIGDDKGRYPHTLRFDDQGRIWYTLTVSNHVARFDPRTEEFVYFDLPGPMTWTGPTPIPVAYGLDVAPDGSIWWSQLLGDTIGVVDPKTGAVRSWKSPVGGPRRLRVGPDNVVWVPGYATSQLGRFDPATESWKVYDLPTQPPGNELPYALSVNRRTNEVWVAGSNSDTLIRFRPESEQWTVFPLATPVDFTREVEFDDQNNVWTCAPDRGTGPDGPLSGRFIKLEVLERIGACGDGEVQLGEQCDDGNGVDGDGCTAGCLWERNTRIAFED